MAADTSSPQRRPTSFYIEPASRETLLKWLETNGIFIHPALRIVDMDEGDGWMVESVGRIPEGELCTSPFICHPTSVV